ncbi:hypothetical protein Glove_499g61 [Diversispora epigaea]|uniref:Uncharacterized protein n=1 Tax=Diversispora epigaea TaxID=1348612 RepID=A0A397GHE9_9GLOM|nr:hypothetical protein Glove_499g61 [Diversispora epigaea]
MTKSKKVTYSFRPIKALKKKTYNKISKKNYETIGKIFTKILSKNKKIGESNKKISKIRKNNKKISKIRKNKKNKKEFSSSSSSSSFSSFSLFSSSPSSPTAFSSSSSPSSSANESSSSSDESESSSEEEKKKKKKTKTIKYLDSESYKRVRKELFLVYNSKYKTKYLIKPELTWVEQRDFIITKLLPRLSKIMNKKYIVSDTDLLEMIHTRWETRHRIHRTIVKGNRKIELRRLRKNTDMQKKKKLRNRAAEYLFQGGDEKLTLYPRKEVKKILNETEYHSEEWEMTDEEYEYGEGSFGDANNRDNDNRNNDDDNNRNNDNNNDNDNNRNNNYDDDNNNSNSNSNSSNRSRGTTAATSVTSTRQKTTSIYIKDKWWRSELLKKLLHKRIDPVIDIVSRPANTQKAQKTRIRSERYKQNKTEAEILKSAPIWTLNEDNDNNEEEENNDNNEEVGTSSRKRKRKGKGKEKEKKNKKSKKNKKK